MSNTIYKCKGSSSHLFWMKTHLNLFSVLWGVDLHILYLRIRLYFHALGLTYDTANNILEIIKQMNRYSWSAIKWDYKSTLIFAVSNEKLHETNENNFRNAFELVVLSGDFGDDANFLDCCMISIQKRSNFNALASVNFSKHVWSCNQCLSISFARLLALSLSIIGSLPLSPCTTCGMQVLVNCVNCVF